MPKHSHNFKDLTGQVFNRFTVISRGQDYAPGIVRWNCRCECGTEKLIHGAALRSGNTKSCGCFKSFGIHGHARRNGRTKVYKAWNSMVSRCQNKNHASWKYYGGRGITVCERWLHSFENFFTDMGEPPTQKHSIDRIDNDGNYCINNCRWTIPKFQSRNTRRNRLIKFRGKTKCLVEWSEETGLTFSQLWGRLNLGWSIDKVFTQPVRAHHRKISPQRRC